MKHSRKLALSTCVVCAFFANTAAFAQCTVPNVIANGQVADASKVMDNFTAIAGCVDAGVKPTGTPQAGSITVFSGSQTVTGGNLTGDVTTSGGTTTTLSDTGVTPGLYVNPNITVDAKGRIVAASSGMASGGSGGGGGGDWAELVVSNAGAETANTDGWTMTGGGFVASTANPANHSFTPIMGSYSFVATANSSPKMFQIVDVSTFAADIDASKVFAKIEALAADTWSTAEQPYLYIEFRNAAGNIIAVTTTAAPARSLGAGIWRFLDAVGRMPPGTRSIAIGAWAVRIEGNNNNVAFDGIRAFLKTE